jgi:hypothetical protein
VPPQMLAIVAAAKTVGSERDQPVQ